MRILLGWMLLSCVVTDLVAADGERPAIVFDPTPEFGIPREAQIQDKGTPKEAGSIAQLLGDSVASIRVRYFDKTWKKQEDVSRYLEGLMTDATNNANARQLWSQGLGVPEIECLIKFKDHAEGRLLLWHSVACLRDAAGRWWFVSLGDYFHAKHPKGRHGAGSTR